MSLRWLNSSTIVERDWPQKARYIAHHPDLPSTTSPMSLVFFVASWSFVRRILIIQIDRPTGSFSLFFLQHADGTWHVFPPNQCRPEMRIEILRLISTHGATDASNATIAPSIMKEFRI
jgi:hypothetical protein